MTDTQFTLILCALAFATALGICVSVLHCSAQAELRRYREGE